MGWIRGEQLLEECYSLARLEVREYLSYANSPREVENC
jgi:hypothetical protein